VLCKCAWEEKSLIGVLYIGAEICFPSKEVRHFDRKKNKLKMLSKEEWSSSLKMDF
jgi:hypothetical protein